MPASDDETPILRADALDDDLQLEAVEAEVPVNLTASDLLLIRQCINVSVSHKYLGVEAMTSFGARDSALDAKLYRAQQVLALGDRQWAKGGVIKHDSGINGDDIPASLRPGEHPHLVSEDFKRKTAEFIEKNDATLRRLTDDPLSGTSSETRRKIAELNSPEYRQKLADELDAMNADLEDDNDD